MSKLDELKAAADAYAAYVTAGASYVAYKKELERCQNLKN